MALHNSHHSKVKADSCMPWSHSKPETLTHHDLHLSLTELDSEPSTNRQSDILITKNPQKTPRKRRRPPFSYSSLIAQAILASEKERLTLQDIYKWITDNYPTLYNEGDTGWQNTIRHNLSLNKCFKKIPKSELDGWPSRGKGGYWVVDPKYLVKFKSGIFIKGSPASMRQQKPLRQDRQEPFGRTSDKRQEQTIKPCVNEPKRLFSVPPPPITTDLHKMQINTLLN